MSYFVFSSSSSCSDDCSSMTWEKEHKVSLKYAPPRDFDSKFVLNQEDD